MDTSIQRITVPECQRVATVSHLFGLSWPLCIEPTIFHWAENLSPDYSGGMWTFYTLAATADSDSGFYMAPDTESEFHVICSGNQWEGTLSANSFGITCCLMTYSQLAFSRNKALSSPMARHYHRLRDYMLEHPEARAILGATD